MRYLLSILVCLYLLCGCTTGRLPLTDQISVPSMTSNQDSGPAKPADQRATPKPSSRPKAMVVEPVQASYSDTILADRF